MKEFGLVLNIKPKINSAITFIFSWKRLLSINFKESSIIVCN